MGKHFLSQKDPHEAIYSNRAAQPYSPQHFSVSARAVTCEVLKDERHYEKKGCISQAQRRLINKWIFIGVLEHHMASGKYMFLLRSKQRGSSFGLWMKMGLEMKQTASLKWKWKRKQHKEPYAWHPWEFSRGEGESHVGRVRCGLRLCRQGNKKIASRGEKCQRNKIGMLKEVLKRIIFPQCIPWNLI